jgi:hypothetical protein
MWRIGARLVPGARGREFKAQWWCFFIFSYFKRTEKWKNSAKGNEHIPIHIEYLHNMYPLILNMYYNA